ncbi:hypothetical protein FQN60_007198 [Etheostoma spectabile]|uniref:Caspase recruitment domain-containing protein n=1 Tax=Etheostoma spectabile TaxID=54343 RepID=A0A5J5CC18_9PERO|nr:hypothetical protein FQN60_007198 [Etheostoma spectabile]
MPFASDKLYNGYLRRNMATIVNTISIPTPLPSSGHTSILHPLPVIGPSQKMSFASDKLYNGYLRRNMPTIVTKVKPTQIMLHLPCLTAHDRESIEAKRETYGNYDSMVVLLDCLKRRENWPEQFQSQLPSNDCRQGPHPSCTLCQSSVPPRRWCKQSGYCYSTS